MMDTSNNQYTSRPPRVDIMAPPTVRVNTFVKVNDKPHVDPISKIFIIMEALFGLDRLPLMGKGNHVYVVATFILFLIINSIIIYFSRNLLAVVVIFTPIAQNIICGLLSFVRCSWMQSFYNELRKFDADADCTPKVSFAGIRNIVLGLLSCIAAILLFVTPYILQFNNSPLHILPVYLVNILEVYYFAHLLNLLIPRLKLINYYIESSLSSANLEPCPVLKEFIYFKSYNPKIAQNSMNKLMDLYQIVVEAYDCLIEGIKWQLLTIIIGAFVSVLGFLYQFSLDTIHDGGVYRKEALFELGVPILVLTPLFAPCMFGDSVHNQVTKLRELLASRLYENKLDKAGRSAARALLAFTETRDLSFRLLRMLNIDISLPFKFVGLLVTYLIILLQFEKVINP